VGLSEEEKSALVTLKVERAKETIEEVPFLIEKGYFRTAANRLYYSCYFVVSALLLHKGFEAHTHKGIIALFSLHFVKTGLVSDMEGQLYRSLFELRQTGDYDDFQVINENMVQERLQPARNFITAIEKIIF
jgi:uncharacterized protein (UPF0332 family)